MTTSIYFQILSAFNTFITTFSSAATRLSFVGSRKQLKEIETLNKGIAELYDTSARLSEETWGEHMHHGYYDLDSSVSISDHRLAQTRLVEESFAFAYGSAEPVKIPKKMVDVGCGIGGSSRHLARKYGFQCKGITLSPVEAQRAQALAAAQGLSDKVSFQVGDALDQPFPDGEFDLVWSMESAEHMPDKKKFVSELARVAAPGATIILATWCHRNLSPSEESLRPDEKKLLDRVSNLYYVPAWCSASDYVKIMESLNLQDIKTADWSENVAPFWSAVETMSWKVFISMLRSGWKTIKGSLVTPLMIEGCKKGLTKFVIITCRKPA